MSDEFKHAIQNMRDILHFQEIEKLTELEFSELVASHDSPTGKQIEQLERELAEAREDAMDHKRMLQSLSKTQALDRAELDRSFQHIMKQRDTLAEALEYLMQSCESIDCEAMMPAAMPFAYIKAKQALAAVKGGQHD